MKNLDGLPSFLIFLLRALDFFLLCLGISSRSVKVIIFTWASASRSVRGMGISLLIDFLGLYFYLASNITEDATSCNPSLKLYDLTCLLFTTDLYLLIPLSACPIDGKLELE